MRFFLVRVALFTILFTLLLLLFSWIAPVWTGNVINHVTSRLPGVEKKLTVSDITNKETNTSTEETTNTTEEGDTTTENTITNDTEKIEDAIETIEDEVIIDVAETPTIAITKDEETKESDKNKAIGEIDNILGVDNIDNVVVVEEPKEQKEPKKPQPTTTKTPTTLTNDDLSILRELEKNTQ